MGVPVHHRVDQPEGAVPALTGNPTRRDDPSTPSSFVEDDAHPQRHAGQWRTHLPESAPSNGNDAGYADPVAR
ncbi:hypothetical protein GCM10025862_34910 [Arsenicicoccus piscis]|uniref:Uncharacterized protein n=1 Tax=Arsenicicoccus piscis TaxID=673954 RepID=A0ABQ6HT79_9MICO|nr:hypothetical protein GCM10025862_34910 [Arsenicicoccus piscis]